MLFGMNPGSVTDGICYVFGGRGPIQVARIDALAIAAFMRGMMPGGWGRAIPILASQAVQPLPAAMHSRGRVSRRRNPNLARDAFDRVFLKSCLKRSKCSSLPSPAAIDSSMTQEAHVMRSAQTARTHW